MIEDDSIVEKDEIFSVRIGSDSGVRLVKPQTEITIVDNDKSGESDDILTGTNLSDRLEGQAGDDYIHGMNGSDIMTGGPGADIFHYQNPLEGTDQITDFNPANDRISYAADAFSNLSADLQHHDIQGFGDMNSMLSAVTSAPDSDVYRIRVDDSSFDFSEGPEGHLDELEAAITSGSHTGAAFIFLSNGLDTQLYFDVDTSSGEDGFGLTNIANLQGVSDATEIPESVINQDPIT